MNNVLTASRLKCATSCLRQHFWKYEVGLAKNETALVLRIGSAWARAMEARWKDADYEQALAAAIPEGIELDNYSCSTIAALLAGYYDFYGSNETCAEIQPEQQFCYDVGNGFTAEGKLDGIGTLRDSRQAIVESKTTGDSVSDGSDYWLRLLFDMQCLQYIHAARQAGWDISVLIYDVVRKPSIRPKTIVDQTKTKKREKIEHFETPDEYCDRLYLDTKARPEFYFARREVPIIDQQIESFIRQREAIANLILSLRKEEVMIVKGIEAEKYYRDPEAWPRNVSENTCKFCSFKSFCLANIDIDIRNPPAGFSIKPFNPELDQYDTTETTDATSSAA